jgi:glucose-6-phosphate dehydrogenase assembly protein OpcA
LTGLTSIRAIEAELATLNEAAAPPGETTTLRTRVMTHVAWVPAAWEQAARGVLAGLAERHPSRTILLLPDRVADESEIEADVDLRCFAGGGPNRSVCSEVVTIRLKGSAASAPASVVQPLLVSDLPAFLRWRGPLPLAAPELEQLVDVVERLIVDSREWEDPESGYRELPTLFSRVAVSDIAWARIEPWRLALAHMWPGVAEANRLRVTGPAADGLLLSHWLGARLRRRIVLESGIEPEVELVEVDGQPVLPDRPTRKSPSELLSDQLEIFGRDPIYEETVASFSEG